MLCWTIHMCIQTRQLGSGKLVLWQIHPWLVTAFPLWLHLSSKNTKNKNKGSEMYLSKSKSKKKSTNETIVFYIFISFCVLRKMTWRTLSWNASSWLTTWGWRLQREDTQEAVRWLRSTVGMCPRTVATNQWNTPAAGRQWHSYKPKVTPTR